jgi:hypothetical protein
LINTKAGNAPTGVTQRQLGADPAAERIADDDDLVQVERVE